MKKTDGQGLVEYALLMVLIAVTMIAAGMIIGEDNLNSAWDWMTNLA